MSKFHLTLAEPELIPIDFTYGEGKAHTLRVRPFNVLDEHWFATSFDHDNLVDPIIRDKDLSQIFSIFVHQLIDSDRALLAKTLDTDESKLVDTLLEITPIDPNEENSAAQNIISVALLSRSKSLPDKVGEAVEAIEKKTFLRQILMRWSVWCVIGTGLMLIGYYIGLSAGY